MLGPFLRGGARVRKKRKSNARHHRGSGLSPVASRMTRVRMFPEDYSRFATADASREIWTYTSRKTKHEAARSFSRAAGRNKRAIAPGQTIFRSGAARTGNRLCVHLGCTLCKRFLAIVTPCLRVIKSPENWPRFGG